ncbi:putative bifunctional diguanylate cyclase/phosphodiesterase [Roseibium sp.]|uniref:putative bifunctional diguanylate cyclase/phosphodiesterase n=1 Tax=Roseibium sp. TaxID=1936156 RepID=UPI003D0C653A
MLSERLFRIAIPGLCCLLILLFEVNTLYLGQAQFLLSQKLSFERAVISDVQHLDTGKLQTRLVRYAANGGKKNEASVQRAYKAFLNAVATFRSSEAGNLALKTTATRNKLAKVLASVNELAAPVASLDTRTSASRALQVLEGISKSLEEIDTAVLKQASNQVKAAFNKLQQHQQYQTGLIFAVLASAISWVWSLHIRNDALNAEVRIHKQRAERFAIKLEHDSLTGLINRPVFIDRVGEALENLARGQTLSVLCVDLESSLPKSDKLDRSVEEAILTSTADILKHTIEPLTRQECVARSDGKNFLILSVSEDGMGLSSLEIANRIRDRFLRPVATAEGAYLITPAIGFADTRVPDHDPRDIVRNACLATAAAVSGERRDVVVFVPAMRHEIDRREVLEASFPRALETNEFLPHFQPQFDLKSGRVLGVEALARWYHAELGWISPSEFIPIAESNGDIVPLGWKILETACAEMRHLPSDLTLSINLSVAHIQSDDVVAMLDECLDRTGFPANRLKLEITETTLKSDLEKIGNTLEHIRALGIRLALDDFGAGYSSLSYLMDFPWDEIKIDRSLCARAVNDPKSRGVLGLILQMAGETGTNVLVEGIESVEQRDALVRLGCTSGQGYLFCGPMALDDIKTLFFPDRGQSGIA